MAADDWRRVEDLYHAASRVASGERARFLDQACAGDAALRREVESLLAYETSAGPFIETPAIEVAARLIARDWSETDAPPDGTIIGGFRLIGKIGEGGMGVVYEAEDTRLGRRVALKFLRGAAGSTAQALERFEREARAASALNHPNICTIYSVRHDEGRPFIEMERLEGETLRDRLARGPLEAAAAIALGLELSDALDAAHAKGIVHCDLTPGNVFLTARGAAKILDFGIARLGADPDRGAAFGTAGYMSPEQIAGGRLDGRTDLFSLGAVLYEAATARAPFEGTTPTAIREAIQGRDPAPPHRINPALPAELDRIILTALRKDRERRYQRASAVREDLERLRHRLAARGQPGRRRWWAAAILLAAIGAAIAFCYSAFGPGDMFNANLRLRQITHNASEYAVGTGAIAPDGRSFAYADARGMHTGPTDTGETQRIAQSDALAGAAHWDVAPGWLPDGSAFVANLIAGDSAAASSVWIVRPPGAPQRLREHARALSVSSDGSRIGFATDGSRAGDRDVWVMDTDGANARRLFAADTGTRILGLSWSPDAARVAYVRADEAGNAIAIDTRGVDGARASTVVTPDRPDVVSRVVWLRDGRLLYSLRRPQAGTSGGVNACTHWQLRVDAAGRAAGRPSRFARWLPQCVTSVSFTADGARALYLQWAFEDAIHVGTLDAAGTRLAATARLTFTEGRNIPGGWTADDRSLVFVSDGAGRAALFRQPIDGDTPQRLADEPGIVGAARLTPDGASVKYLVRAWGLVTGASERLMQVASGGGPSREILSAAFVDGGARCATAPASLCAFTERSADGRQLIFMELLAGGARGRELGREAADPAADYRWSLSADGSRIVLLNVKSPRLRILSLAGLPARDIVLDGVATLGYVSWTSDGAGLIVPSVDARGASLLAVDLAGHTSTLWRQPGALDISGIPSHDGRRIAVWVRNRQSNLWIAESR